MSAPPTTRGEPITDRRQLAAYLESGCKPAPDWRIGTEHEKFAYRTSDLRPLPYDGPDGIRELLTRLTRFGWQPVEEKGHIIALVQDKANITLEPGGQVELSGAPLETLHQTCAEVHRHLRQVKEVGAELGIAVMGLGFQPKWTRDDIPWMPKGRYKIMRDYMPKVGSLGLDMMTRTCTVQVNLDFASEADMVKKFRVSLALQPVATALFAMSPFTEGKLNGFQSFRSHIWTDTDPDRTGDIPFVFEDSFGFERYVDYLLDTPMYFVYRDGVYIDAAGQSFRDFMDGKLPALPGEVPLITDWADHTTTAFPEVRLKKYLEMRGADSGPAAYLCALPALWVGLLYDQVALDAAWDMVKDWTTAERAHLRAEVPRSGLRTGFRGRSVREVALEVLAIARDGLGRRARTNRDGHDESIHIDPILEIAKSGKSLSDNLLELYSGPWGGDMTKLYEECTY